MKIGVTSQNKLKVDAVKKAYSFIGDSLEVFGYEADSGVGEQPIEEQALQGARNRISDIRSKIDGLDRIISIESGIFMEDGKWLDKAVIVIYNPHDDKENIAYSDAVIFPDKYVKIARQKGFDTTTVGQVMEDEGYVKNRKDPHLTISGISRQTYLENTIQKLVNQIETQ